MNLKKVLLIPAESATTALRLPPEPPELTLSQELSTKLHHRHKFQSLPTEKLGHKPS